MTQLERFLLGKINEPGCPVHYIQIYHALFRK